MEDLDSANRGLFEVTPGIYQVRFKKDYYITFIQGESGWICVDAFISTPYFETAKQILDEYFGKKDISGIVYSHGHEVKTLGLEGKHSLESQLIDGVHFDFIMVSKEANFPQYIFFLPCFNAIYSTEAISNIYFSGYSTFKDIKTLICGLDTLLQHFSNDIAVIFMSRHFPIRGNIECIKHLKLNRDLSKYIHDQTFALAKQGHKPNKIINNLAVSNEISQIWKSMINKEKLSLIVKDVYEKYLNFCADGPNGIHSLPNIESSLTANSVEMLLEALCLRVNTKVAFNKNITINVHVTDIGKTYKLKLKNSVLNFRETFNLIDDHTALFLDASELKNLILFAPNYTFDSIKCKTLGNDKEVQEFIVSFFPYN